MGHMLYRQQELPTEQALTNLAEYPSTAAHLLIKKAAENDCEAQALLGQILLDGRGIQQDSALALKWFKVAAGRGHAMAANMVGRCFEHGWGTVADATQAARWYQLAATRGLDWGLYNWANLLATGRGVMQDIPHAFQLYLQAANMGHAKSMNLVGRYYEEGTATLVVDLPQAHRWYQRSAEAGDFRGQFSHACVLATQERWDEARYWLQRALQLGHLKFLRTARDALQAANLSPLQDITQAYIERCAQLQGVA